MNASFNSVATGATAGSGYYGGITGVLDLGASLRDATGGSESIHCDSNGCRNEAFDCNIPARSDDQWQSSFCHIYAFDRPYYDLDVSWNSTQPPWAQNSSIYLAFVTNMDNSSWASLPEDYTVDASDSLQEWTSYNLQNGFRVNVSLCFSAFHMERQYVRMTTSGILKEPVVDWDTTTDAWNTTDVQNFLGINGGDKIQDDSGLQLAILGPPNDGTPSSPANVLFPTDGNVTRGTDTQLIYEELYYDALTYSLVPNATFRGCTNCVLNAVNAHREVGMLWGDIIQATKRPVEALQSIKTIYAWTIYESFQRSLGVPEEVKLASILLVRTPGPCGVHGCGGYISFVLLVSFHLILIAAITAIYAKQIRYSRCGNIWHTLSQLQSLEVKEVIQQANSASDKEMRKWLRQKKKDDFVRLKETGTDREVELIECAPDYRRPFRFEKRRLVNYLNFRRSK